MRESDMRRSRYIFNFHIYIHVFPPFSPYIQFDQSEDMFIFFCVAPICVGLAIYLTFLFEGNTNLRCYDINF